MKEKLTNWANIAQIGSFVLQIASIIIPLLTVGFLSLQEEPLVINTLNLKLGKSYQLLLLFSALIIYLDFLRKKYDKTEVGKKPDYFIEYLFFSLISSHFLLFLPLFVITILIMIVQPIFIAVWIAVFIFLISFKEVSSLQPYQYEQWWDQDNRYSSSWTNRISNLLDENDLVSTQDFFDYGFSYKDSEEINYALWRYFKIHEFEKHLKLSPEEFDNQIGIGIRKHIRKGNQKMQ